MLARILARSSTLPDASTTLRPASAAAASLSASTGRGGAALGFCFPFAFLAFPCFEFFFPLAAAIRLRSDNACGEHAFDAANLFHDVAPDGAIGVDERVGVFAARLVQQVGDVQVGRG